MLVDFDVNYTNQFNHSVLKAFSKIVLQSHSMFFDFHFDVNPG